MSDNANKQGHVQAIFATHGRVDALEISEDFVNHMLSPRRSYRKHRVTLAEIVEAHENSPEYWENEGSERTALILMAGLTNSGRIIVVPIAPTGEWGVWRPKTAFAANAHHKRRYTQGDSHGTRNSTRIQDGSERD